MNTECCTLNDNLQITITSQKRFVHYSVTSIIDRVHKL